MEKQAPLLALLPLGRRAGRSRLGLPRRDGRGGRRKRPTPPMKQPVKEATVSKASIDDRFLTSEAMSRAIRGVGLDRFDGPPEDPRYLRWTRKGIRAGLVGDGPRVWRLDEILECIGDCDNDVNYVFTMYFDHETMDEVVSVCGVSGHGRTVVDAAAALLIELEKSGK